LYIEPSDLKNQIKSDLSIQSLRVTRHNGQVSTRDPDIVPCVKSFIEQGSAEVHLRRRTSVMYTNGVTLKDIANHVNSTLGISVSRHIQYMA